MNFLRWHRRGGEAPAGSGEVAIVAAAGQIVGLGLVAVGLALEADAVVGYYLKPYSNTLVIRNIIVYFVFYSNMIVTK